MSLEKDNSPPGRLEMLAEANRLPVMERALRLQSRQHTERIEKVKSARERVEKRLKELEGG